MPQRETPLRAELRESKLVWTQKFGQRVSMACGADFVCQTIAREDRLHSNVSNFSSYESLKIEC